MFSYDDYRQIIEIIQEGGRAKKYAEALGSDDFMRVPLPAAMIRTPGGVVAKPFTIPFTSLSGWGGWIRTSDDGAKVRCLAAWLHPNIEYINNYTGTAERSQLAHRHGGT